MVLEGHIRESYDMVRQIGKGFSTNRITWRSEGWDDATMHMESEKVLGEKPSGRREHDKCRVLEGVQWGSRVEAEMFKKVDEEP